MKDAFDFIVEHAETIRAVLRSYINELPLAAVLLLAVSSYFFNWHLKIGWFKVRFEELQQLNQGKALHYSASLRRTLAITKGTTDQTPSTILLVRERVFGWFGDGIWTARSLLKAVAVGTAFPFMIIALVWAATGNGQIRGLNMLPDWSAQPFWLRLCVLYVALLQFPLAIRLRRTSFETWTFVCQIGWKVLAGLVCTYGAIRFLFSDYFYFRGSLDFFALATLDLSVSLLNLVLLSVAGTMGARFFLRLAGLAAKSADLWTIYFVSVFGLVNAGNIGFQQVIPFSTPLFIALLSCTSALGIALGVELSLRLDKFLSPYFFDKPRSADTYILYAIAYIATLCLAVWLEPQGESSIETQSAILTVVVIPALCSGFAWVAMATTRQLLEWYRSLSPPLQLTLVFIDTFVSTLIAIVMCWALLGTLLAAGTAGWHVGEQSLSELLIHNPSDPRVVWIVIVASVVALPVGLHWATWITMLLQGTLGINRVELDEDLLSLSGRMKSSEGSAQPVILLDAFGQNYAGFKLSQPVELSGARLHKVFAYLYLDRAFIAMFTISALIVLWPKYFNHLVRLVGQ